MYVANRGSNTLSAISTATNQVSPSTIPAGAEPDFIALTSDGKKAYVADAAANQVLPISLPGGTPGTPIAVGKSPWGIAITPDGTRAYVANSNDNSVTPVDLTAASPVAGTPIGVGADPTLISITPDGKLAQVANAADGTVTSIDVASNSAGLAFSVGSGAGSSPDALAIVAVQPVLSAPARPVKQPSSAPNSNAGSSGATAATATINDSDPNIMYTGGGWAAYPGRPAALGDLNNDVHATRNNGDSVSYTFKGTGIAYVSERSDGYGTVQVALDGSVQTIVDANAPGIHNQGGQTLYSISGLASGQHTLTLTKTGGAFMLLDDFVIQTAVGPRATPNGQLINDTDPQVTYAGSGWGYYNGRPGSVYDVQNDVHATTNNGDSVSFAFTGSGVSYVSELSDGYGQVEVYLDGALQATVDANAPGVHNAGGQILFSRSGLSSGQHTLKLVKKSGVYMLLDAFIVQP